MPKSRIPKSRKSSQKKRVAIGKRLTWPPEMNGDVLELVLDQVALYKSSIRSSMYDEWAYQGVPHVSGRSSGTLKSSSSVCRAWRFPAQKRLFCSIRLDGDDKATKLAAALKDDRLSIIPRHATLYLPLSACRAVTAIASITRLQSLVLKSWDIGINCSRTDTTQICTLMMDNCTFFASTTSFHSCVVGMISFDILARFLAAMPRLKNLTLNVAGISKSILEHNHNPPPTFTLKHLELLDEGWLPGGFELYTWLLGSSRDSLETLTLHFPSLPSDYKPFMDAFTMIAPSLKILRMPYLAVNRAHISAMISQCTSLVELGLDVDCFRAHATSIVESLPPTLRCLRVGEISQDNEERKNNSQSRFTVVRKAVVRSLLPASLTTIAIDIKEWDMPLDIKHQVMTMARAFAPKGITVWIADPRGERNLSDKIKRKSSPGYVKCSPVPHIDFDASSCEGLGVDFDTGSEDERSSRAYESDFTDLGWHDSDEVEEQFDLSGPKGFEDFTEEEVKRLRRRQFAEQYM